MTPRWLVAALWFFALLLVLFGVLETWLGNSIGEMQNFILAGFALRFFCRDIFE